MIEQKNELITWARNWIFSVLKWRYFIILLVANWQIIWIKIALWRHSFQKYSGSLPRAIIVKFLLQFNYDRELARAALERDEPVWRAGGSFLIKLSHLTCKKPEIKFDDVCQSFSPFFSKRSLLHSILFGYPFFGGNMFVIEKVKFRTFRKHFKFLSGSFASSSRPSPIAFKFDSNTSTKSKSKCSLVIQFNFK